MYTTVITRTRGPGVGLLPVTGVAALQNQVVMAVVLIVVGLLVVRHGRVQLGRS